jgi:hypothetical protein
VVFTNTTTSKSTHTHQKQNATNSLRPVSFMDAENHLWCWMTERSFAIIYKWHKPFKEIISLYIETCTVGVSDTGHI